MEQVFPFGFPTATAFYLTLYIVTALIYVVFKSYVFAGTAYMLYARVRPHREPAGVDPLDSTLRDWMPAMLGLAITAGIGPLLFLQILYKKPFYTANLLMFNRWMAFLPCLIVAYYALYILKSHRIEHRWPAVRLIGALLAFGCVMYAAWAWVENHLLSLDRAAWVPMYASGSWAYATGETWPRLLAWFCLAFPWLAIVLGWQLHWKAELEKTPVDSSTTKRLAFLALGGLAATAITTIWYTLGLDPSVRAGSTSRLGLPYAFLAVSGAATEAVVWFFVFKTPTLTTRRLSQATAAAIAMTVGSLVVRETRRLGAVDLETLYPLHEKAFGIGGFGVFLTFFAINALVITACVIIVRRGLHQHGGVLDHSA
jgi:hypothetical protein